jgi:hypothetical protein
MSLTEYDNFPVGLLIFIPSLSVTHVSEEDDVWHY